jgi:small conductance mechanosensitive channel
MENLNSFLSTYSQSILGYLPKVALALVTLLIGFWIINKVTGYVTNGLQKTGTDSTVSRFLASIVNVGLRIMLLLSVAGMFGIETTSFIAIFTALVFAIGTALSGSIGHFASGVMLLVFRPYKVGDLVSLQGQTGDVEDVQVFNTIIRTPDNKRIIIPNGVVTSGIITNISGQGTIRVDMTYGIAGDQDVDKARAAIQEVANNCPTCLKNPSVDIYVNSLKVGITELAVRPWCNSADYWDTYFFFQENILKTFARHGIAAPKPAMDVQVKNG